MEKLTRLLILVLTAGSVFMACEKQETPPGIIEDIPSVTSISPTKGPASTQVTIRGKNFSANVDDNNVLFGTQEATVLEASTTELLVEVPEIPEEEPTSFKIRVTVDNKFGTSVETYNVTTSITLNATSLQLFTKDIVDTLKVTNIDEFENPTIQWESNNEEVLTVGDNGHLMALSPGVAVITATLEEFGYEAAIETSVLPNFIAAGYKKVGDDANVAMFWSNTTGQELENSGINSMANAMVLTETDTLIVGSNTTDFNVATLWVNGDAQGLESSSKDASATSIALNGTEQLIGGTILNDNSFLEATLWTNGEQDVLGGGLVNDYVTSVAVRNEEVIVGGHTHLEGGDNTNSIAALWINGEGQELTNGSSHAAVNALAIKGDEILSVGYQGFNATLWRNGNEETLPFTETASAEEILVVGDNEYIVGHTAAGSAQLSINGVVTVLSQNYSKAFSIAEKNGNILIGGWEQEVATVWWINSDGEIHTIPLEESISAVKSIAMD